MPLPTQTAVVILPTSHAADLLDLAQQWTTSWLMTPAAYVDPSDVSPGAGDEQIHVPCRVLAHGGPVELDLFHTLGRFDANLLRLVAIRVVGADNPRATADGQQLSLIRQALERSRPQSRRLIAVNLLVAPTGRGGVADYRGLVLPDWVNVAASPEDRESLDGYDRFTRESDPQRFVGFALSHAAAAGGLWAGSSVGPYDCADPGGVTGITVQRASLRGVFADGMLAEVATSTAARMIDSKLLTDQLVVGRMACIKPLPFDQVEPATRRLVADTLDFDDGALKYRPAPPPASVGTRELTFGEQVAEFGRFAREVLASVPTAMAQGFARRASRRITNTLHGSDGEAQVVFPRWMPTLTAELGEETRDLEARQRKVVAALDQPLPRAREDLNPRLWASMRQLAFAVLDGSAMPSGMERIGEESPTVEVFPDANSVIPDWRDQWTPTRSGVADAEDRFDLHEAPAHWHRDDELVRWSSRLAAVGDGQAELAKEKHVQVATLNQKVDELEAQLARADTDATRCTDEVDTLRAELDDLVPPGEQDSAPSGSVHRAALAARHAAKEQQQ